MFESYPERSEGTVAEKSKERFGSESLAKPERKGIMSIVNGNSIN